MLMLLCLETLNVPGKYYAFIYDSASKLTKDYFKYILQKKKIEPKKILNSRLKKIYCKGCWMTKRELLLEILQSKTT